MQKISSVLMHPNGPRFGGVCLQMDSNTIVADWDQLLNVTFRQKNPTDMLTMSRCSNVYIAPTSKIFFISGNSSLFYNLQDSLDKYFNSDEAKRDKALGSLVEDLCTKEFLVEQCI